jgi:drug/metabolite transporter (DMT)-like permease
MWLFIALLGNVALAVVGVMNKLILTKFVSKPIILAFYSTIFVLPLFLLLPFGVKIPGVLTDYLVFAVSGLGFAFGVWTMYVAFQESEVSHVGPLVGVAVTLFILFLSRIFLAEKLSAYNLLAVVVLIVGSLIISFEKSAQHNGWHRGMEWGVLAGFLFAVSHVAAKYIYGVYDFYSGFIWTRLPIGIFGAVLLLFPSVRALFHQRCPESAPHGGGKRLALIAGTIILGLVGVILTQYAAALGSVSLVNALAGAQYALIIIFVAALSKFWPRILTETYGRKEIIQEAAAVAMIGLGLVLLIIK